MDLLNPHGLIYLIMSRYIPDEILIDCVKVSKSFWNNNKEYKVFDKFDLQIEFGKVTCILGPSGCGKSTLLNIISNIDTEIQGDVLCRNDEMRISYLFQEDLLLPWLTAYKNALLGVKFIEHDSTHFDNINRLFEKFGLSKFVKYYPFELSGGMKQRVSLIRTLAALPNLVLFDEPFTALDFHQKLMIEKMIIDEKNERNQTLVFVTHDIDEAIALGDRVIVIGGQPAMQIYNQKIIFKSDISGRDPIKVREDPEFATFFKSIYSVFDYEK